MHKTFLIPILLTAFLYACTAVATEVPTFADIPTSATQTPYVITATPYATLGSDTATPSSTPDCPVYPPITVGYIPDLDLGGKQSVVSVSQNCAFVTIAGEGWSVSLSPDSCIFYADKEYPCDFTVNENGNIRAYYHNKVNRDFLICLAIDSKSFNKECG